MYIVYQIEIQGLVRYIGYTDDLTRRQKQHNYMCFIKKQKKRLYDSVLKTNCAYLILKPIRQFTTKVEAKRYECFLILKDHFNERNLWQHIPKITDM